MLDICFILYNCLRLFGGFNDYKVRSDMRDATLREVQLS